MKLSWNSTQNPFQSQLFVQQVNDYVVVGGVRCAFVVFENMAEETIVRVSDLFIVS